MPATAALLIMLAVAAFIALQDRGTPTSPGPGRVLLTGFGSSLNGFGSSLNGKEAASTRGASGGATGVKSRPPFSIAGGLTGLYPGLTAPLVLTLSNPGQTQITVTSVTTSVGDASASCPAADVSVSAFSGRLVVPAHGSAALTVSATMAHTAPDACQGAVFPFTYTGQATGP